MIATWKQNLKKLSSREYKFLLEMAHLSKNVYNESLYNIRQHYFAEGSYLKYEANYPLMKASENYKLLGVQVAQQTMKCVDWAFRSFFGLLKLVKNKQFSKDQVRIPHYLPKGGDERDPDSDYPKCYLNRILKQVASDTGKNLANRENFIEIAGRQDLDKVKKVCNRSFDRFSEEYVKLLNEYGKEEH